MITFKLNNGYIIPCIGYGTFPQKESLVYNSPIALRLGYQLIDVSDNYSNEEYVGKGMKSENDLSNKTVVVSKFSQPIRTYELERCFEESKHKLQNNLDIYLLHWPYPFLWKAQWRRMEKLYTEGKCKAIGVCNLKKSTLRN